VPSGFGTLPGLVLTTARRIKAFPVRPGDTWQFEEERIGRVTVVDVTPYRFFGVPMLEVQCVRHGDAQQFILGYAAFESAKLLGRVGLKSRPSLKIRN
jgi:hypothetical protein